MIEADEGRSWYRDWGCTAAEYINMMKSRDDKICWFLSLWMSGKTSHVSKCKLVRQSRMTKLGQFCEATFNQNEGIIPDALHLDHHHSRFRCIRFRYLGKACTRVHQRTSCSHFGDNGQNLRSGYYWYVNPFKRCMSILIALLLSESCMEHEQFIDAAGRIGGIIWKLEDSLVIANHRRSEFNTFSRTCQLFESLHNLRRCLQAVIALRMEQKVQRLQNLRNNASNFQLSHSKRNSDAVLEDNKSKKTVHSIETNLTHLVDVQSVLK